MNKTTLLLLSALTLFSCNSSDVEITIKNGLVIENARIISPTDESISPESYIVIEGDSILFIGIDRPNLKGEFQTVDAEGQYIIPGLIDSHVHVTGTGALTDKEEIENPEIEKSFRMQLPKSYLYFGYTTLIDLGAAKLKRLSQFEDVELTPDLYSVGGGVVIGQGYGMTNWEDDTPNFIYQEDENIPIPEKYLKENHTPEVVIKRISESGAIAVKTYYEPGFDPTQPRLPTPSVVLFAKLREESHKHNLMIAAHGNSLEAHQFLGNAKVDIITHGLWNWVNYRLDDTGNVPTEIAEILDVEINNNVRYIATLQVMNGLRSLAEPEFLNNTELTNVLPISLIDYYKANSDAMYLAVFGDAPKEMILNSFDRISKQGKASLKYMSSHNGIVLFGTDTPSSPTFGNPPGYNGYLEMLAMENAGIPLNKILASATINNAKAFGLEKLYGSVEKGKKANILILNKNPLEDITAYNDISKIIMRGKVVNRNILSAKTTEE